MNRLKSTVQWGIVLLILGATTLAYRNHFDNSFQFDDAHTIQDNLWIRFYEKNGFATIGSHLFQLGEDAQADILMKKIL